MTWGVKHFCTAIGSIVLAVMLSTSLGKAQSLGDIDVKIAVLAFRGKAEAMQQWQPTADYLSDRVKGRTFSIIPLTLTEMQSAVENEAVDFILTNPGNYVDHEAARGVARIATIRPNTHQKTDSLGATIFTRNVDNGIETIRDLRDKRFMAVRENAFGGFQMAWREMQAEGLNPFKDLADLIFVGFPQDKAVEGVLAGDADAGTVRAGVLENLAETGVIKLSDLRILNPQNVPGFPFALSTRLYPEWPFAKLKNTPEMLAQQVVIALLGMPTDHPAAFIGDYAGWTVPLDYQPVHELFKELHIGPYDLPVEIKLSDLLEQYWQWGVFAGVLMGIAILWVVRVEHLVAERTAELSHANAELETQIFERKRAEDNARQRQNELAHVSRVNTMGELTASLAHEINQPLSAIANYATGSVRRLDLDTISPKDLHGVLSTIAAQAERAAEVIRRVRAFVRKGELSLETQNINAIARETIEITHAEAERQNIELECTCGAGLPPVVVDKVQIEQVLLNLIGNAMDALQDSNKSPKTIVIATRLGDQGDVICEVRDNGPGLSETANDLLFEPFYSTKPNGMGMGLSISRSIIEASGGHLSVEVDADGATVLKFSLPGAPQPTAPSSTKMETRHV